MPIYEYECSTCGEEHEVIQRMGDDALRECPGCGALGLRRKISRSAFHLKGTGWYVTDYASNGKEKKEDAGSAASDSKPAEKVADKKEAAASGEAAKTAQKEAKKPVAAS